MAKSYLQELSENYDGTDDEPVSYVGPSNLLSTSSEDEDLYQYAMQDPKMRANVALGYGPAMQKQIKNNDAFAQSLAAKRAAHVPQSKLENYLASVDNPAEYRTAMMQYMAQGGRKPAWYTGDYETDKGNIETAIAATMTPQQQLIRQDAHQKLQDLQEARQARLDLQKQKLEDQAKAQAAKQAGLEAAQNLKAIPNGEQRKQALGALESALGADAFNQLPAEQQESAARTIAAKAKAAMLTPEGKGVDYETLLQDQLDEMIAQGQLNPGKEGTGILGFFGMGDEAPSFKPGKQNFSKETEKPTTKESLPVPQPGTIVKGYRFKGGNPADKNSWEKQ